MNSIKKELVSYLNISKEKEKSLEDNNIIVTAGAGSGKTKSLVARYLYLILIKNIPPEKILALTYTNKAAAEMKERIRRTLIDIYEKDEKAKKLRQLLRDHYENFEEKKEKDLLGIEFSFISTFHSFAQSIISSMPIEFSSGVDIQIIDDIAEFILIDDIIKEVITDILNNGKDNALYKDIVDLMGVISLQKLMEYTKTAVLSWHTKGRERGIYDFFETKYKEFIRSEYNDTLDRLKEKLKIELLNIKDHRINIKKNKNIETFDKLTSFLSKFSMGNSFFDIANSLFQRFPSFSFNKNTTNDEKEYLIEIEKTIENVFEILNIIYSGVIIRFGDLVNNRMEEELQKKNILTFSRMIELLADTLENNRELRNTLQVRFDGILIDEFQDANDLEKKVVYYIAGEGKGNDLDSFTFPKGKLYIVGDPKQSIYYFRNADVSVFIKTISHFYKMSYTVLQYGDNYRSEEELIDYYNTTLSKILNGKSGKLYDIEYGRPLNCKKNEPTENGEVGYIDTDNIYESTARLILHLKYEEGCNFKDITVLLKNYRSEIDNYTNLFAIYNIPFLSSGEDTIGDYIELDSIIKYLSALSNPYDDIKLISLFKTPFFYIDDVTLYDISKVEKNNYFEKSEEYFKDHKKFNSKFSIFRTLLQEVNIKSNEDIIKSIIKRNNYDYYLSLRENKKILMSGVNKIIKIARELTIQNLFTFYELSNYLNSNSDIIPINNDIANDEDVVRIITVHKSKGLEFPIVIYPQMDKGTKNRNRSVFYMEENGIIFKFIKKTKYLDSIKTLINDKEEKEYYRLLYVAFTRAKEKLFLLSKDNKNKEIKDIVKEGYEWNVSLSEIENIEITKEKTTLLPIKKISIIPSEIGMSVSNFLENICFQGDGKKEKKKEVRSELAVIGTIVHNILENDDFEFEKVNFNDLPESVYEKVKNIIEKYKNSSIFNEISSSNGNDFREVEVAGIYNYNGVNYMLHGRIDRLIINKNGNATLIDYKTSISGSGFERDKMQLKIYKKILSNRFKIIDAFLLDLENLRKIRISEQ